MKDAKVRALSLLRCNLEDIKRVEHNGDMVGIKVSKEDRPIKRESL